MTYSMNDHKGWRLHIAERTGGVHWEGPHVTLSADCEAEFQPDSQSDSKAAWDFISRQTDDHPSLEIEGCRVQISDVFERAGVEMERQIGFNPDDLSAFYIRLIIRNLRSDAIIMNRLTPLRIQGQDHLIIGEKPAGAWSFYRHGRHKNDLPSVCLLGDTNGAYLDALKGLTEAGKPMQVDLDNVPSHIISDQLSVIRGHEGHGPGALLLGFIEGTSQLVQSSITVDRANAHFERLELTCLFDDISLEPGELREGEWLRVDGNKDSFAAIDNYARIKGMVTQSVPSTLPSSVYCTWYYYGQTITSEDVQENLQTLSEQSFPIDGFQIDMGWERRFGDWDANHKFPEGMQAVAEQIAAHGYRPGIWTAPFLVEPRCDLIYYHPEWLLMTTNGERVKFLMNNVFNFVLDVTHPEVLQWIEQLFRRMTAEWRYTYHKLDFTRAVVADPNVRYYDTKATRAEAYRRGIEAVRKGTGPDAYVLICGGLYDAVLGLVNGQRTGSDVLSMWPATNLSGEIEAPLTIKQNVLRYWMNRLWNNDPDALMVRRRSEVFRGRNLSLGLLTDNEARISTLNQYWGGGLVCFTEPMREVEADRIGLLRHVVPPIGTSAIPRDMFLGKRYPEIMDVEVCPKAPEMDNWHTVTLVNWTDKNVQPSVQINEQYVGAYAAPGVHYALSEFWSGRIWTDLTYGSTIQLDEVGPHAASHLKLVRMPEELPLLLYTNGHFSMGGTEITSWSYRDQRLSVGFNWPWDIPFHCVIRAPKHQQWVINHPYCEGDSTDEANIHVRLPGKFTSIIELALR